MNPNITFKAQDNQSIIEIQKISIDDIDWFKRVYFKLIVNIDIFSAETTEEAEVSDFEILKDELKKMYNLKIKGCIFKPLDERLIIKFSLQETGVINIKFELHDNLYSGFLSSEFRTDITYLPDIIRDIELFLCFNGTV